VQVQGWLIKRLFEVSVHFTLVDLPGDACGRLHCLSYPYTVQLIVDRSVSAFWRQLAFRFCEQQAAFQREAAHSLGRRVQRAIMLIGP
jgi:hypothetical protein